MDLLGIPVVASERVPRDMVLAQESGGLIVHPLMLIQIRAGRDTAKRLRDVEAWIVSRANSQADAAIRRLKSA